MSCESDAHPIVLIGYWPFNCMVKCNELAEIINS